MSEEATRQRWVEAPPWSHSGEFGPDDQRGRMNLVTAGKVLQGLAEVRHGRTFCLSLPLDVPGGQSMNPRRIAPRCYALTRDGKSAGQQGFCWSYSDEDPDLTDVVNDDIVLMSLQFSTQWDSLAHMGSRFDADGTLYFTDQGQTGLHDPTGRLYRLRQDGQLDLLLDNVPSPNSVALSPVVLRSCAGASLTNIAFGGLEGRTLFCTESVSGSILMADLEVAGVMFHRGAGESAQSAPSLRSSEPAASQAYRNTP